MLIRLREAFHYRAHNVWLDLWNRYHREVFFRLGIWHRNKGMDLLDRLEAMDEHE